MSGKVTASSALQNILLSEIPLLLLQIQSVRLRTMFRIVILFISIVWASLLLISWGGATAAPEAQQQVVSSSDRS